MFRTKKQKLDNIKLLDITVDGGKSYNAVGVYTGEVKAREAVKDFIEKYNKERDVDRGEVEYTYDERIWFTTDTKELVFPFGPNAEFRIRQLRLNQPIAIKD